MLTVIDVEGELMTAGKRTVYKIKLEPIFQQKIQKYWKMLHFAYQNNIPHVWVEVDPSQDFETVECCIVGTGFPIPAGFKYLNTIFKDSLVWHFYYKPNVDS